MMVTLHELCYEVTQMVCIKLYLIYPTVFCGEEVLTLVKVTGIRHSIMTCRVTCSAVQRNKVVCNLSQGLHLLHQQNSCVLSSLGIE